MKRRLTERFRRSYSAAPPMVQEAFDKQSRLLLENFRYPSLQVKKYDEAKGLWQARVTRSWRFYFKIEGDTYIIEDIIPTRNESRRRVFGRWQAASP